MSLSRSARTMPDHVIPLDWRIAVAVATVIIAGIAKGVTGMGLPVAGLPILVALYGDLRLMVLVTILGTAVADIPMLWRFRAAYREATILAGFLICGLIGIVIGTQILAVAPIALLCALLAAVVIVFIVVSWFGVLPTMSRTTAMRAGPAIGLLCGILQGSAGASGPVVTSFLVSTRLSREGFLFAINAIFLVLDWTQFTTIHLKYAASAGVWLVSAIILVLVLAGMAIGFAIQKRIDDAIFRRAVLVMLAFAAIGLITRALRG